MVLMAAKNLLFISIEVLHSLIPSREFRIQRIKKEGQKGYNRNRLAANMTLQSPTSGCSQVAVCGIYRALVRHFESKGLERSSKNAV